MPAFVFNGSKISHLLQVVGRGIETRGSGEIGRMVGERGKQRERALLIASRKCHYLFVFALHEKNC